MDILIVGLGSIAKKHIAALKNLSVKFKIFALRSSIDAPQYEDVINVFTLDDKNFDFAIISNPTHLHSRFIKLLATKSIPLFIEKPPAHNFENLDEISNLISEKNLTTYVACNLRFHPCIAHIKNKLNTESPRINEVNVYCGSYLPDWRPEKNFRESYSANASSGGGVHLDLFHELDYTAWLFGLPNKSKSLFRSVSSLKIDAIDYANYIFEYDFFTINMMLNYYRKKSKRQIEIVLDYDVWTVDLINNEIKNDKGGLIFKASNYKVIDTYIYQLDYFIKCLKTKKKPMNSFSSSLEILKICLNNE